MGRLRRFVDGCEDSASLNTGCSSNGASFFDQHTAQKPVATGPELLRTAVVEPIMSHDYYGTHTDWVKNYIEKQGLDGCNSDIVSVKAATTINQKLKQGIDVRLFSKVEGAATVSDAFKVQMFHARE